MAEHSPKIEKLNSSNYQSWKFNIRLLLVEKGLEGYCEEPFESEPTLESSGNDAAVFQKAKRDFDSRKNKTWAVICLNVDPDQQIHVADTTTAQEAWENLSKVYDVKSVAQLVRLKRRFCAASMSEGGNLQEHVMLMTQLAKQLKEQGQNITSAEFALTVLGSLPESYDGFLMSMNARDPKELTWESVRPALLEEYQRRNDSQKKEQAFFVNRKPFGGKGKGPKESVGQQSLKTEVTKTRTIRCYHCHEEGHEEKLSFVTRKVAGKQERWCIGLCRCEDRGRRCGKFRATNGFDSKF